MSLLYTLVAGQGGGQQPVGLGDATFFGGIQINEPDHDRWAAAVRVAGLDSIQVTLYGRQLRWDGAEIEFDREWPWVVSEIRAAKRAGLRTVLVIRLALEHGRAENRHLWHGMIWPRDQELDDWFARYRELVLRGAEMAAREGVDLFVVGNELSSLSSTAQLRELPDLYAYYMDTDSVARVRDELVRCADQLGRDGRELLQLDGRRFATLRELLLDQERIHRGWLTTIAGSPPDVGRLNERRRRYEEFWRSLIAESREVYRGPITYGANWDQFDQVGFWDATDALATTAYFPLGLVALEPEGRRAHMRRSWGRVVDRLQAVAAAAADPPLPTLLLELGWTRRSGATVRPYSYGVVEVLETVGASREPPYPLTCVHWATQPFDPSERIDAIAALAEVVDAGQFDSLQGFTLWKLTTSPEHRGIEPFAVILDAEGASAQSEQRRSEEPFPATSLEPDREYLGHAAAIARRVTDRLRRWHNGADANLDRQ